MAALRSSGSPRSPDLRSFWRPLLEDMGPWCASGAPVCASEVVAMEGKRRKRRRRGRWRREVEEGAEEEEGGVGLDIPLRICASYLDWEKDTLWPAPASSAPMALGATEGAHGKSKRGQRKKGEGGGEWGEGGRGGESERGAVSHNPLIKVTSHKSQVKSQDSTTEECRERACSVCSLFSGPCHQQESESWVGYICEGENLGERSGGRVGSQNLTGLKRMNQLRWRVPPAPLYFTRRR